MIKMKIEELKRVLTKGSQMEYEGKCHDCGNVVTVSIYQDEETGAITVEGGAVYNPLVGMPPKERIYLKCDSCYHVDHILSNWQECDVYSRVVGYLRPVSDWNKGKTAEWAERKEFRIR
jgi:hypothetical protein